MALVDLYQLVLFYKLARGDVGTLSNPSRSPLPMGRSKSGHPPAAPIDNRQTYSSLPVTVRGTPGTPTRIRTLAKSCQTPTSRGTSIRQKQEFDMDRNGKYNSDDYKQFILHDLEHHRVFVDMEDFMKHVLHVPDDWKTEWGPTITKVKENEKFIFERDRYSIQCDTINSKEDLFYGPLVDMVNAILDITSTVESLKPMTPQRYIVNDPNKLACGVLEKGGLSPDIIAIRKVSSEEEGVEEGGEEGKENGEGGRGEGGRLAVVEEQDENEEPDDNEGQGVDERLESGKSGGRKHDETNEEKGRGQEATSEGGEKPRIEKNDLTWAHPLQVLEVKPFDSTLIDGSWVPRLKRNGTLAKISADVLRLTRDLRARPQN